MRYSAYDVFHAFRKSTAVLEDVVRFTHPT